MSNAIYNLIFGTDSGQVCCCFQHDGGIYEHKPSAGIGPNGEYHCFSCGISCHDPAGFISKYFNIPINQAVSMEKRLDNILGLKYTQGKPTDEQVEYLKNCGICDKIIEKYFFTSTNGKLYYRHTYNGIMIGATWFNAPALKNYNASESKYKYTISKGGLCSPYDDVIKYPTLMVCEGEKDMLTAKSMGFDNAVAKIGGANSTIVAGQDWLNKKVVLIYDCDTPGREGMIKDADYLVTEFNCQVKCVNLNLNDKEDLNDYFIKYKHTKADLVQLIKDTPLHTLSEHHTKSKMQRLIDNLTQCEIEELKTILNKPMEDEE